MLQPSNRKKKKHYTPQVGEKVKIGIRSNGSGKIQRASSEAIELITAVMEGDRVKVSSGDTWNVKFNSKDLKTAKWWAYR